MFPTPHLMALKAFSSLNLGLPARALLPASTGLGKQSQAKALPFCDSKQHQGWPVGPPLLVPATTPQHRKSRLPAPEEAPHLVNKSNIYKCTVLELVVPPGGYAFEPCIPCTPLEAPDHI